MVASAAGTCLSWATTKASLVETSASLCTCINSLTVGLRPGAGVNKHGHIECSKNKGGVCGMGGGLNSAIGVKFGGGEKEIPVGLAWSTMLRS